MKPTQTKTLHRVPVDVMLLQAALSHLSDNAEEVDVYPSPTPCRGVATVVWSMEIDEDGIEWVVEGYANASTVPS